MKKLKIRDLVWGYNRFIRKFYAKTCLGDIFITYDKSIGRYIVEKIKEDDCCEHQFIEFSKAVYFANKYWRKIAKEVLDDILVKD